MKSKPLGKGLQALFEESSLADFVEGDAKFLDIPVEKVHPNPLQPRETVDPEQFQALKSSVKNRGIIQPIAVRQKEDHFEIVAGERRWRAVCELEMETIPAYVLHIEDERHLLEVSMLENIHRSDLNPIELASGYHKLSSDYGLTQKQISDTFSIDRSTVANMIRLLKLPEEIQNSLKKGEISTGHARALISLPTASEQRKLWKSIVSENLSVRRVEELLKGAPKEQKPPDGQIQTKKTAMILQLEDRLRQTLGTQVRIKGGKNGGKIEIDFYSVEDLDRLMELFTIIQKTY
ncbi:ParB/RepB/Spo0J family partition protein [candidate division KSB1 bacterium]